MSITLNRSDLEFLLRQVTINYLAPDAANPGQVITAPFNYSMLVNALDPSGLREVSGSNNNLVGGFWDANTQTWVPGPNASWGESDQPFLNQAVGQGVASAPDAAYNIPGGPIADTDPRIVSNLVATMFTSGPNANPAAVDAATNGASGSVFEGQQVNGQDAAFVANAGVLGGGRYNGWFVAFGQFFDHGLDFVARDSDPAATITINLSPNDPLYSLGADAASGGTGANADVTSIRVRRADVANASQAGDDNTFGTTDDVGYSAGADGTQGTGDDVYAKPQYVNKTGLLIDQSQTYGSHASVNALIREYDASGHPTGRVIASHTELGPNQSSGLATWADLKINAARIGVTLTDGDIHDAPVLRVDPAGKLMFTPNPGEMYTTAQIVGFDPNNQDPNDPFVRDSNGNVLRTGQDMLIDFNPGQPLDAHIITGDGRANENIGLTAVHHVFHEEHNGQVANIQQTIINQYTAILNDPGPSGGATAAAAFIAPWQSSPGVWDGEKLFQAARLITESEYNHIAIDQYVGTLYGALPEFVSYSSDINMGVSLEFSQAVFRLGHSMLTETFNVVDPNTQQPLKLLDMFLNPALYQEIGPTALAQGLTTTLGNEVDEFVTPALQQSLLGQPLDLATINIARGRDVNLPTWNEFRKQVYDQVIQNTNNTNGSALAPYTSWADVGDHLKHTGTLVNFIAAYAHDSGTFDWGIDEARAAYEAGTGTLDEVRAAAQTLYDAYLDASDPNHAAAVEFMQGTPVYDQGTGQWTFQGADQGFWDIDLWIGGLAERPLFDGPLGTTFSFVILDFGQRMQDGDRFYYLYRTPMGTHLGNEIIENQFANLVMEHTGLQHANGEIFIWSNQTYDLTQGADYFNAATQTILDVDGTPMPASAGHLVIGGNGGDDLLIGGLGDDTVYGDDGNDQIQGSQGNDHLFGGAGDDVITDDENDDFIAGGAGNDRLFAGPGALDTVFGDEGDDEIHGGDGIDELLGGEGNDIIYGDGDTDVLFGETGDDYLAGGDSVDEMWGGDGNDWLRGGVGDDHLQGMGGNDLLEGGTGPAANDGDRLIGEGGLDFGLAPAEDAGFDIASYQGANIAITADLETSNQNGTGGLLDTYVGIDGLVGSRFGDNLTGAGPGTASTNGVNNLLVGGGGDDMLTGLGGDDIIVGDAVVTRSDFTVDAGPYATVANWRGTGESRPDFGGAIGLGYFLGNTGAAGTADKAVFSGNFSDYTITLEVDGWIRLVDNRGVDSTAAGDRVKDVELFQFADGTRTAAQLVNQAPVDIQWNASAAGSGLPGNGTIARLATVDPDNTAPFTYTLLSEAGPGSFTVSSAGVVTRTGGALSENEVYTLDIRTTDATGGEYDEKFRILTGSNGFNAALVGSGGDDIVYAMNGNDAVSGLAGDDSLFGQNGDDTLNGGDGNDVLNGGNNTDTASYDGASAGVTASLAVVGLQDTVGAGLDTLVSIENLTGSAFGDTLSGNGSSNTFTGGGGHDILNGAGGGDTAVFLGPLANYTFALSSPGIVAVTDSVATDGTDTLSSIEHVQFDGQTFNLRFGTAAGETLNFNGGADLILGFGGNDTLNGNGGADVLVGGVGNDTLNGGQGSDTAVFNGPVTDYGFSLGGSGLVVADTVALRDGTDTLNSIQDVQFGTSTYNLIAGGNTGSNVNGSNGVADLLLGFGGNDELDGGTGADAMAGGTGSDDFNFDDGDTGVGAGVRDIVLDFLGGSDQLDFSAIDANSAVGGGGGNGQAFTSFQGNGAFTGAQQLRAEQIDTNGDSVFDSTVVQGNVNADLNAEFEVLLQNYLGPLQANDFFF